MVKKSQNQNSGQPKKKTSPRTPKSPDRPPTITKKLPNVWRLSRMAVNTLWQHRKLFFGITLIYGLLNLLLVQGLAAGTDIKGLKYELNSIFTGQFGSLASSLSIFALLVGSAGNGSSETAGAYQFFIGLIASLAVIWALRQVLASNSVRVRDAYYRGMHPLVPFILVLMVIGLQLIPLLIGSALYSIVTTNGIAVYAIEKILWAVAFGGLALLSLYLTSSSLFALYIVTLPNMTPLKALRSARQLVKGQRWTVLRKIVGLPLMLLFVAAVVVVPIIIWLTPLTQWVFFVLTMLGLTAVHAYMYTLYRELLDE